MPQSIKDGGGSVVVNNIGGITINAREDKFVDITSEVRIGGRAVIRTINFAADAGSTDAYAITMDPAITAYQTGQVFWFKANTANTGAATLNVNALGAKAIKKLAGAITTVLDNSDIRAGQYVEVVYDGTNFQMLSASGNAPEPSGSAAAILATAISDGDLTHAPDGNSVFDALALKVAGPGSATADAFTQFDGTTGKLVKSGVTLDTDGTLAGDSDIRLASQKAVKTYADTKQAALTNPVVGVGASYKVARGVAAITGTGDVVTGLTTVVAITATAQDDLDGDAFAGVSATIGDQAGSPVAGSVTIKCWKVTTGGAAGNPTLIAASAAKNVNWVAVGL